MNMKNAIAVFEAPTQSCCSRLGNGNIPPIINMLPSHITLSSFMGCTTTSTIIILFLKREEEERRKRIEENKKKKEKKKR